MLVAPRWSLAVLRHRRFYHLEDLNAAIEASVPYLARDAGGGLHGVFEKRLLSFDDRREAWALEIGVGLMKMLNSTACRF